MILLLKHFAAGIVQTKSNTSLKSQNIEQNISGIHADKKIKLRRHSNNTIMENTTLQAVSNFQHAQGNLPILTEINGVQIFLPYITNHLFFCKVAEIKNPTESKYFY